MVSISLSASGKLDKSGGTLTGPLILERDPLLDLEAATRQFVLAHAGGGGGVQIGGDLGGTNSAPTVIGTHLAAPLPLNQGGTNAADAPGARAQLGLGTAATANTGAFDAAGVAAAALAAAEANAASTYLPLAGGALTGPLAMGAHKVTGVANGTTATDGAAFGQVPTVGAAGSGAGNALSANDATTTNARTPTAHASTHATGGSDPLTPAAIGAASASALGGAALLNVGTVAGTVAAGDDSRITGAVQKSLATTKGDLLAATGAGAITRLGAGGDGQLLSAASGQSAGLQWVAAPVIPGAASSVVTETGYGQTQAVGTDTTYAREDHTHGSPSLAATAPATTLGIGQGAAVGTAATPARADHVHPLAASATPGASAVGDTAAAGSATTFAAGDHKHGREGFGAVTALGAFNTASATGVATTVSHSDHVHGAPALPAAGTGAAGIVQLDGIAGDIAALGAQSAGAIGKAADAGHVHPTTGLVLASQLPLSIANGGTSAATAPAALANLGAVASDWCDMLGLGLLTAPLTDSAVTYQQTPGDLVLCLCTPSKTRSISTLGIWVTAAGATGSGVNALMLFSEAGVLIDQTGDMTAAFSSTGMAEGAMGGAHTVTAGTNYYLAFLTHFSGTSPHFAATGTTQTANFPVTNGHYTAVFKGGQGSVPLSFTPSSYTPNSGYFIMYGR